jgi:hypothetical protein
MSYFYELGFKVKRWFFRIDNNGELFFKFIKDKNH